MDLEDSENKSLQTAAAVIAHQQIEFMNRIFSYAAEHGFSLEELAKKQGINCFFEFQAGGKTHKKVIIPALLSIKDPVSGKPFRELSLEELPAATQTDHNYDFDFDYDFYNTPSSPTIDLINRSMSASGNVDRITRENKANHTRQINSYELFNEDGKNTNIISVKSGNSSVTVALPDIMEFTKSCKPARKIFTFALIKINEQAYSRGNLKRDYIQFSLQELVDNGNYSTKSNAARGIRSAMKLLQGYQTETISSKEGQRGRSYELQQLFYNTKIENNVCTIYINPYAKWDAITEFYTVLPKYCFKLPNRAFDLLDYIFYLARQNTKKIAENGCFTISTAAIQNHMGLPDLIDNPHPNESIRQPILDAVKAIRKENGNNSDFTIELLDCNGNVAEFLTNGRLKINLSGKYSQKFAEIEMSKVKKIEQKQKKTKKKNEQASKS